MAQAMGCDLCGQETAILLQTNIDNGDVVAIGGSCMVTFLLSTAATILEDMPADHRGRYAEIIRPVTEQLANHVVAADAADAAAAAAGEPVAADRQPGEHPDQGEIDNLHTAGLRERDEAEHGAAGVLQQQS
jgi:hypothetical protein